MLRRSTIHGYYGCPMMNDDQMIMNGRLFPVGLFAEKAANDRNYTQVHNHKTQCRLKAMVTGCMTVVPTLHHDSQAVQVSLANTRPSKKGLT